MMRVRMSFVMCYVYGISGTSLCTCDLLAMYKNKGITDNKTRQSIRAQLVLISPEALF